ncbi:MAG: type VI secretion system accessory protein TagJ, partial [Verrucomicrobiales bacterium]
PHTMDSASYLQEAHLEEALSALQDEVRKAPSQVDLRVRLFALNCVLGRWEKGGSDLGVIKTLDKSWFLPAQVYLSLLGAESLRREVFFAKAKPEMLGEPEPWIGWNVQALALDAERRFSEASELRRQAWESAPEFKANVDGQTCEWLSDADRRIGPVLEVILEGKYYWVPFSHIRKVEVTPPEFLADTVWIGAKLHIRGGAELSAHLPARYPRTEFSSEGNVRLGRMTDWVMDDGGELRPVGQKLFESATEQFGLLSCRSIDFE